MAMGKPLIVQIVGFQNSGKTTFVKQLLKELSKLNFRVATIKHHGHGGKPDVIETKDSSEHIRAGAFASLVEGEGRLLLQVEKEKWSLEEKILMVSSMNPDIIVVEGHKEESYHKIVLLRNEEDFEELKGLHNVLAFSSRDTIHWKTGLPVWDKHETLNWLVNYCIQQRENYKEQ
jgi:molybdopterin-guanine dinucleotide biosynthesis adapter protein